MERGILVGAIAVAGLLGLLLVALAIRSWLRQSVHGSPRKPLLYGGVGIGCLVVSSWVAYQFWHQLRASLRGDYTATADLVEELRNAKLAFPPERKPDAVDHWPQWRGAYRDGISDETGLNVDWNAKTPRVLWKQPIGGGYSSIAVVDGRLYTMDRQGENERIICLNAETGEMVWEHVYQPENYPKLTSHAEGPRTTPTIADGRLYAVGATGTLLCLKLPAKPEDSPQELWKIEFMSEFDVRVSGGWWGFACSPLIVDDKVVVQPGGKKGAVAAFDRVSGKLVWWSKNNDDAGYSSPVYCTIAGVPQVVCFTGGHLIGLAPQDGRELWNFKWTTSYHCNAATPIVVSDYVFISSGYNTGCAILKIERGLGDNLKAIPIYERPNKIMRNHFQSCVFHQDHLFGSDSAGRQWLSCIDFRTLTVKWTKEMPQASIVAAAGHLILLDQEGRLHCVEANAEKFISKGELKLLTGSQCWAAPALASGRLYARSHKEIVCVDLRK